MQTHCVKSWFLTHGKLFTWPLTLLAETGSKEGILKFAKDFTEKLIGEGGACSMLCGQHQTCCSRAVGVWEETWSAVSATSRHKHVSKLPQSCSVCFFYHTTLQRWLEVEIQQGISSGYWVLYEVSTRARNMIVLGWQSAESYQDVHKVIERAGQSYSSSDQGNVLSLCWGVITVASEVGEYFILCPSR